MADKKVTELTAITSVSGDDLLLVVNDPLGTPGSRKITLKDFFSTVGVEQVYTAQSTFTANVTMSGTNVDISSDVDVTGELTVDGYNVLTELDNKMGVSNAVSTFATIDQVNDRMQVANTVLLVNDRIQVSNADAKYATSVDSNLTGITTIASANCTSVSSANVSTQELNSDFVNVRNNLTVSRMNGFILEDDGSLGVPSTSNAATESVTAGTIWYSNNHIYIATDANTIKRVDLSTF
jgi:hypothetical protein